MTAARTRLVPRDRWARGLGTTGWARRLGLSLAGAALVVGVSGCAGASDGPASDQPAAGPVAADETTSETSGSDAASQEALERYVEASRAAVEAELESFQDVYSDFTLRAEGSGTLVYEHTYRDQVDAGATRDAISASRSDFEQVAHDDVLPEMRSIGVSDPAVRWVYRNADGTEIVSIDVAS